MGPTVTIKNFSFKIIKPLKQRNKPYECDVCHQRFRLPGIMRQHRMIHTGEKPHECQVCGQRFRQKGDHLIHLKKHESRGECSLVKVTNEKNLNMFVPQVVAEHENEDAVRLLVEASQIQPE